MEITDTENLVPGKGQLQFIQFRVTCQSSLKRTLPVLSCSIKEVGVSNLEVDIVIIILAYF